MRFIVRRTSVLGLGCEIIFQILAWVSNDPSQLGSNSSYALLLLASAGVFRTAT